MVLFATKDIVSFFVLLLRTLQLMLCQSESESLRLIQHNTQVKLLVIPPWRAGATARPVASKLVLRCNSGFLKTSRCSREMKTLSSTRILLALVSSETLAQSVDLSATRFLATAPKLPHSEVRKRNIYEVSVVAIPFRCEYFLGIRHDLTSDTCRLLCSVL
jgi:hypothetical protein